jgi:hypothetical protein
MFPQALRSGPTEVQLLPLQGDDDGCAAAMAATAMRLM